MTTAFYLFLNLPPRNGGIDKPFCQISGREDDQQGFTGSRSAAVFGARRPAGVFRAAPRFAASNLRV